MLKQEGWVGHLEGLIEYLIAASGFRLSCEPRFDHFIYWTKTDHSENVLEHY